MSIFRLRKLLPTAMLGAAIALAVASTAHAQQVVALVDGQPITARDLEVRGKLMQLSSPEHKVPARQEVLDVLIDEILEIREASRFGINVPDTEVDNAFNNVATRMGGDAAKLTEVLTKAGSSAGTLKQQLHAQLAWTALVRGRFKASLEIADKDVEAQLQLHGGEEKTDVGYEYSLRPIVFIVPHGAPDAAYEARKRDADTLRGRFESCSDGIPFVRALREVAVRDPIIKFSADLPDQLRKILDSVEVGHLTPPETTSEGVQMFAVCAKRQTKNDTPEKHQLRDAMFQKKFGAQAKRYLAQLRREAMIEYK